MNTCEHCGQVIVGDECNCHAAARSRMQDHQSMEAKTEIDNLFGEQCTEAGLTPIAEEIVAELKTTADKIAHEQYYSANFTLKGGVKAKLKRGAGGAVVIERTLSAKWEAKVAEPW